MSFESSVVDTRNIKVTVSKTVLFAKTKMANNNTVLPRFGLYSESVLSSTRHDQFIQTHGEDHEARQETPCEPRTPNSEPDTPVKSRAGR